MGGPRATHGDHLRWSAMKWSTICRSISAPAALVSRGGGPCTTAALLWSAFVLLSIGIPVLLPIFAGIVPRRPGISVRSHWRAVAADFELAFAQFAFRVTFLAHQALLMTDAIARTLFRMLVTRRRMLEWVTAAQASLSARLDLVGFYRRLAGAVVVAVSAAAIVAYAAPRSLIVAAPVVVLWMLSPAVARWASRRPSAEGANAVSETDARTLRTIARRTWRFFETFVTAEDHMLPPDNFQEDPKPVIAHRTSPTNLGLYLLAVIAARDFGWIGTFDTLERLEATLATMSDLERFRGHFFNWYDTQDLHPLEPRYVSSVDSGNLAGHLIAIGNACREMRAGPVVVQNWLQGIEDALALAREAVAALDAGRSDAGSPKELEAALDAVAASLPSVAERSSMGLDAIRASLAKLAEADTIADVAGFCG